MENILLTEQEVNKRNAKAIKRYTKGIDKNLNNVAKYTGMGVKSLMKAVESNPQDFEVYEIDCDEQQGNKIKMLKTLN